MLKNCIAVIGQGAAPFREALARLCADVLVLPPCPGMDPRVASHPDMLMTVIGQNVILPGAYACREDVSPLLDILHRRCGCRMVCADLTPGDTYPADAAYNSLSFGTTLYGKLSSLSPDILRIAAACGMDTADVRQGYTGCSALSCGDILLTADPSIRDAVVARGGEVLLLTPGGIRLPGYNTGFIGGAGGCVMGNAVFFGDVRRHPDGDRIADVLAGRGITCHALSEDPLTDFGGIKFFPHLA